MEFMRLLLKIVIVLKIFVFYGPVAVLAQDFIVDPYLARGPFSLIPDDKYEAKETPAELDGTAGSNAVTPYIGGKEDYSIKPIHYKYKIRPIFDPADDEASRFTIPSSADILVECKEATTKIVLNTLLINIDTTSVRIVPTRGEKAPPLKIKSHTFDVDEKSNEYVITLAEELTPGEFYELHIDYVAKVFRDRLSGIYFSNYTDPASGEKKCLVASHFEPKDARQAFPCFDYPDQKATFEISVGRREKYNTLSNMEVYKTEPIKGLDGWFWDHYNSTGVPMSTYLVALVVSEFTSETADLSLFNGKPVSVWAPPHQIDAQGGILGAEVAAKILQFYQSYFDIDYPLPKMDSAAIPHFSAGAMENWGLNLYRPQYLLYFPGTSGERERLDVTSVIGHELAHQWFGDLVTCRTWSQIYLNEGFASYVENLGIHAVFPEFEIWNMFSTKKLQTALLNDQAPETSHPIVDDTNPDVAYFDRITYSKGSSVIKMMEDFLGEKVLQAGLRAYLKKFALGNAHQDDLYSVLQEVAIQFDPTLSNSYSTLSSIMGTWTLQKGYPLVRVKMVDEGLMLTQEPFVYNEKPVPAAIAVSDANVTQKADDTAAAQRWWVPVRVASDSKESELFWISATSALRKYHDLDVANRKWVIVNPQATGFYRVLYDEELCARIQNQLSLDHSVMSPPARAQFIDDYFTLAFSDYVHINNALDFTLYLGEETEYNVWATTYSSFRKVFRLFGKSDAYSKLQTYLISRVSSALDKIGFEQKPGEKGTRVLARSHLLGFAIALEEQRSLQYAETLFDAWTQDRAVNKIPADLEAAVLCASIKVKGKPAWDVVFNFYQEEASKPTATLTRQQALLAALFCTKSKDMLSRLLHETLTPAALLDAGYDKKSMRRVYEKFASASLASREVLMDFLYESTYDMNRVIQGDPHLDLPVVEIITTLSHYLHSQVELRQMENLVNTYSEGLKSKVDAKTFEKSKKQFTKSVQRVRDNREWLVRFYEPIYSWLQKHVWNEIRL